MERIAIISDIHGNLEALKSVLQDIKERGISRIFCLGDIISKGLHDSECISLVKQSCELVLLGNNEESYCKEIQQYTEEEKQNPRLLQVLQNTNEEEREYLRNLPFCFEFYLSGSLVRLFHSSQQSTGDIVFYLDDIPTKSKLFDPSTKTTSLTADIVIYGHLHSHFMEKFYNKTLINAGSVGEPAELIRNNMKNSPNTETTNAHYLIIEGYYGWEKNKKSISFQFVRVPYDIERELNNNLSHPYRESYEQELREGIYIETDRILKLYKTRGIDTDKF